MASRRRKLFIQLYIVGFTEYFYCNSCFSLAAADSGVAKAVESCQSNKKMKHMVMFGLRTLSDFCTPPRGRYK